MSAKNTNTATTTPTASAEPAMMHLTIHRMTADSVRVSIAAAV